MKIISWNIAAGRALASKNHWDYKSENLDYFAKNIQKLNPDIICLQEIHINKKRSIAKEIAQKLNISNIHEVSSNPSHIDSQYDLGLAVLSKYEISNPEIIKLPYPKFKLVFSDSREAKQIDKHIQRVTIKELKVVNTQFQPLGLWKYRYDEGKGFKYSEDINKVLGKIDKIDIFCGDLAMDYPLKVLPVLKDKFHMQEAFKDTNTRPVDKDFIARIGKKYIPNEIDHILFSDKLKLIRSGVVKTNTDHLLCWGELNIK